jgi:hypothetical protein
MCKDGSTHSDPGREIRFFTEAFDITKNQYFVSKVLDTHINLINTSDHEYLSARKGRKELTWLFPAGPPVGQGQLANSSAPAWTELKYVRS